MEKKNQRSKLFVLIIAICIFTIGLCGLLKQNTEPMLITEDVLEHKESLNEEELKQVCDSTLIVQGDVTIDDENIVGYEQWGDIHVMIYSSASYAEEQYQKYIKMETVEYCEYDLVVAAQTRDDSNEEHASESVTVSGSSALPSGEYVNYDGGAVKIAVLDSGYNGTYKIGYNAFNGSDDVTDLTGHGTSMVNYILEQSENVDIIPVKILGDDGIGTISDVIKGIAFAMEQDVTVINMSFTALYTDESSILNDYIANILEQEKIYFVAAAGNSGNNADFYTPANISDIYVVGSSDQEGNKQEFSNWGDTVDFYVVSDSTSEAAAKTSGLIASCLSQDKIPEYAFGNHDEWFPSDPEEYDEYLEYYPIDEDGNIVLANGYVTRTTYWVLNDTIKLNSSLALYGYAGASSSSTSYSSGTTCYTRAQSGSYYVYEYSGVYWYYMSKAKGSNSSCGWTKESLIKAACNSFHLWYNPNGGTLSSSTYDLYDGTIRRVSDLTRYFDKVIYNETCDPYNASTFGLSRTGYTFSCWNTKADGTGTDFGQSTDYKATTYKSNVQTTNGGYTTLYAKWTPNNYTITYNYNGSGTANATATVSYGSSYTLRTTSTTRTGYTFKGWSTSSTATTGSTGTQTCSGARTWYAVWSKNSYTITYNYNGSGTANATASVGYGDSYTLRTTSTTRTGYTFKGWSTSSTATTGSTGTQTCTGAKTWYAIWAKNSYTIDLNPVVDGTRYANGHSDITMDIYINGSMVANDVKDYYATKEYGDSWEIKDIKIADNKWKYSSGSLSGTLGAASISLEPTFVSNSFTWTWNANGGSISPTSTTQVYGTSVTFPTPTRTGYTFTGWKSNNTGTVYQAGTSHTLTSNVTFTAQWVLTSYTWTWNADGGTVTPASTTQSYGTTVTFPTPTRPGYAFTGWKSNSTGTIYQAGATQTITSNVSFTAQWILDTFTITYDYNGNGVSDLKIDVMNGDDYTLTTSNITRTGYTFKGWSTRATDTNGVTGTQTCTDHVTWYAIWSLNIYDITYELDGGTVSGNPDGYTVITDDITLINPTKTGYTFIGWSGSNGVEKEMSLVIKTGSTGDKTYTANWLINTYTNTVHHWLQGVQPYGNDESGSKFYFGKSTDETIYMEKQVYDDKLALIIPNGCYLTTEITTSDYANTKYSIGDALTQPAKNCEVNYYYSAINYKIEYSLDGGTNNSTNPTNYDVLNGVALEEPTKEGFTFMGWELNGVKISGINVNKDTDFSSIVNMYEELSGRMTGNITLTATWDECPMLTAEDTKLFLEYGDMLYENRVLSTAKAIDPEDNDISDQVKIANADEIESFIRMYQGSLGSNKKYMIDVDYRVTDSAGGTATTKEQLTIFDIN